MQAFLANLEAVEQSLSQARQELTKISKELCNAPETISRLEELKQAHTTLMAETRERKKDIFETALRMAKALGIYSFSYKNMAVSESTGLISLTNPRWSQERHWETKEYSGKSVSFFVSDPEPEVYRQACLSIISAVSGRLHYIQSQEAKSAELLGSIQPFLAEIPKLLTALTHC